MDSNNTNVTLDLDDPFDKVVMEMLRLNRAKRSDYAGDDHPYQNFIDSADQTNDCAGKSVETLIATKQSRLRHLLFTDRDVINEPCRDTLIDRAVYAVIAVGLYDEGHYE
jgi:hypothetical protein